jgi:ribonuclease BN (tRNA processing enzyme)
MNYIKFLGTAGARFVMMKQLRASGGIWFSLDDTRMLVDPGPGAVVKVNSSRPRLPAEKLDAIFLSHRHIDHSNDINVMIEAMTDGGFKKRSVLLCPGDALENPPVVFPYVQKFLDKIEILKAGNQYKIKNLTIDIPCRMHHGVETYGFKLLSDSLPVISYLPDTEFAEDIIDGYSGTEILIISVVFFEPRPGIPHLSLPEAMNIIKSIKPRKAIMTHFGMGMLKNRIWEKTEKLSENAGLEIIAAKDGMTVEI